MMDWVYRKVAEERTSDRPRSARKNSGKSDRKCYRSWSRGTQGRGGSKGRKTKTPDRKYANEKIKLPSDTTLYIPALRMGKEGERDMVDKISKFIANIRVEGDQRRSLMPRNRD